MKVKIRLKPLLLNKIKAKKMNLGDHEIKTEYQELEISEKLVMSEQANYWMDVEILDFEKPKPKAKKPEPVEAPVEEEEVVAEVEDSPEPEED